MLLIAFESQKDALVFCRVQMERVELLVATLEIPSPGDIPVKDFKPELDAAMSWADVSCSLSWLLVLLGDISGSLPSDPLRAALTMELASVLKGMLAALGKARGLPAE